MPAVTPLGQALKTCLPSGPVLLDRWTTLSLITDLRRELGITDREIMVLRAHLSVLPHGPLDPRKLNMSFMNLQEIHDRACGMEPRRFRRGEARLEEVGLIRRQLSANGRRFPERNREGQIVNAYGIDLSPLLARHAELIATRDRIAEERLALRSRKNSLSARLQNMLRDLTAVCTALPDWLESFRQHVRNILRRASVTVSDLDALEVEMDRISEDVTLEIVPEDLQDTAVTPHSPASTTEVSPAVQMDISAHDGGQSVRHIESKLKESKKEEAQFDLARIHMIWNETQTIREFFPERPRNAHALAGILIQFSSFIGLGQTITLHGLRIFGPGGMIQVLDYLAGKAGSIKQPEGYMSAMIKSYEAGQPVAAGRVAKRSTDRSQTYAHHAAHGFA